MVDKTGKHFRNETMPQGGVLWRPISCQWLEIKSMTWARTSLMNVAQRQHTPRKLSQMLNCKGEVLNNTKKKCIPLIFLQMTNINLHREFVQSLGQPEIYKQRWKTNTRMHPFGEGVQPLSNAWEVFMEATDETEDRVPQVDERVEEANRRVTTRTWVSYLTKIWQTTVNCLVN